MIKEYKLKFYLTETAYACGNYAYSVTIKGDRHAAVDFAKGIMEGNPNFQYYEVEEVK